MWVGSTSDTFSEKRFKDRIRFISFVFLGGFSIICLRLFYLQVVKGDDFALVSESNRTKTIFLSAPRGNFIDKDNNILVTNRPSWSIMYSVPSDSSMTQEMVAERLNPFLAQFPRRWERRYHRV